MKIAYWQVCGGNPEGINACFQTSANTCKRTQTHMPDMTRIAQCKRTQIHMQTRTIVTLVWQPDGAMYIGTKGLGTAVPAVCLP